METKLQYKRSREASDRIRPASLAHIVLRTGQHQKMVGWYEHVLNAEIVYSNDHLTFLTYDDEHHRIAIAKLPVTGRRDKSRAGVDHIAFTYESLPLLLENWSRLQEDGIEPIWCINHGPTTSMYYQDPDGNVLELQVENFESDSEVDEWMSSSDFDINPIGVDFDPAEMKRKFDSGVPVEELKVRPRIGKRSASTVPTPYIGKFAATMTRVAKLLGKDV
ncbi:VOC family protein [Henriciella sp. AS95]|uniref:VOC family protein n=1 Tax=Henriciella sp. AS95 TaxID=3135782 RepID=UPI0031763918